MGFIRKLLGDHRGGGGHHGGNKHGGYGSSGLGYNQGGVGAGPSCPKCRAVNGAGAKFCQQCGTALTPAACGQCGTGLQAGAKFCAQCGTQVP